MKRDPKERVGTMTWRSMLALGVVVGAMTVFAVEVGSGNANTVAGATGGQLVGTWTYKVNVTGVPTGFPRGYTSLITFVPGGGLIQTAWTPPANAPAGITGVSPWIGHGEWVRTGTREFVLTVVIPRFDRSGKFVGLAKSRASIKLDATNRNASGHFDGDILNAEHKVVLTGFGGTVSATRFQIERPK
jgi:hypothetical protein